jgi:hypothetical protein
MNWDDYKNKNSEHWCFCGLPATQIIGGIHFCHKHKKLKEEVQKIGRYSGASKTPYGKYEER